MLSFVTIISNLLVDKPVSMHRERSIVAKTKNKHCIARHLPLHRHAFLTLVKLPLDIERTIDIKCTVLTFIVPLLFTNVYHNSILVQLVITSALTCNHLCIPENFICSFVLRTGAVAMKLSPPVSSPVLRLTVKGVEFFVWFTFWTCLDRCLHLTWITCSSKWKCDPKMFL